MVIARIDFSGTINSRTAKQFREIFSYIEGSNKVKAAILVINSGGGDAASSEILMNSLKKITAKKPVFAVIENIGASGAYWVASSASKIYALNTSVIGSIGVIGITPNLREFLNKIGIKMEVVKMGEYKDMLNPFTEPDAISREKYADILEYSYNSFKTSLALNRKLSAEDLDKVATGEIFSAGMGIKLGLIDKIGSVDDAIDDLMNTFKIKGKVRAFEPHRTFFERIFTSSVGQYFLEKLLQIN